MRAYQPAWRGSTTWQRPPSSSSSGSGGSLDGPVWKSPEDRRRERLNSELLTLAFRMDPGAVERLLQSAGPRPSQNAYCGDTKASALHIATMRGDEYTIKVLLKAGADPESRDIKGQLPLHLAVWEGNIRTTKILLKAKPSLINAPVLRPQMAWSAGDCCGWEHDHDEVTKLMNMAKTKEGSTALHIASMHCQKGVLDFLLENGANVRAVDAEGRTPLDVAGLETCSQQELVTPASPVGATTYSASFGPAPYSPPFDTTPYSMATAYSGSMGFAPFPATTYATPMADGPVIPANFFTKPGSSLASSAKDLTEAEIPQSDPQPEPKSSPLEDDQKRAASPLPPIGMDGVGPTDTLMHQIVKALFRQKSSTVMDEEIVSEAVDAEQQSSLALLRAIANDNIPIMEMLLDNGASLTAFDENGDAPIHVAVRKAKLGALKVIVQRLGHERIDMKNKEGMTALHLAVNSQWRQGVGYLLECQASVRVKVDLNGQTVYHMAAILGNPELMKELLCVKEFPEMINEKDNEGFTPLLRAVQKSSLWVVELLVKTARADVTIHLKDGSNIIHLAVTSSNRPVLSFLVRLSSCHKLINEVTPAGAGGMAPIHIAADMGDVEKTQILLKKGASPSLHTTHEPLGYVTALHLAAKKGYRKTIETILKFDSSCLQAEDKDGWTPLHTACSFGHGKSAIALVKYGADLSDKVDFHGSTKTALDLMVVNVPRCYELLQELFDTYIQASDVKGKNRGFKYLNNPQCKIELNFQVLLSSHDTCGRQLLFLNSIVNTSNTQVSDILLHPLIEVFLHIKWSKMWKFFAILLFFNFVHTIALTAFCAVIFIQHYNNVLWQTVLQTTFLAMLVPIVSAEILQLLRLERHYWNDYESWIKWLMIFTSGTVGYGSILAKDIEWIRHFSSFAILSAWIELLFLFSRFRYWGLDVLMFEKVIENVLTVLSKFVFLFLGFMFALMVHFEGGAPFGNVWDSFCQVIVMIVELNYGGVFSEESKTVNAVIGRLVYVCYMLFVALAMINLTVGLAVSDIADLEKQGRVERLIKRTSFLSFLETLAYDKRIIQCFPPRPDKTGQSSLRSVDKVFYVYPNKPGILPIRLKNALLLKIQEPESTESLTTEHFDNIIKEINNKMDRISRDIANITKSESRNLKTEESH